MTLEKSKNDIKSSAKLKVIVETAIFNAEKVLLQLAKEGKEVIHKSICVDKNDSNSANDIRFPYPHKVEAIVNMTTKMKSDTTSYSSSQISPHTNLDNLFDINDITETSSTIGSRKAKFVPGSLCITESARTAGIIINFSVMVNTSEGSKKIPVCIECPNFQPTRICFRGEWRNIMAT